MSLLINSIKQVKCVMTKHLPTEEDEDELFKKGIMEHKAKCKRCGTPILLTKDDNDDGFYFVSELNPNSKQ